VGLLPLWGINGAASGTLLALLAQAVVLRFAVSRRHGVAHSRPRVLVFIALVVGGCLGSVWLPQTFVWDVVRFGVAVICLVPFGLALRRLQRD
jgi:membrane-associated PAP2 superfamily phosphatase